MQPAGALFFRRFAGRQPEVRGVLAEAMAALDQAVLTPEARASAELVLAEVLNNIIEHAYACDSGVIEITLAHGVSGIDCELVDFGAPMPEGRLPPGRLGMVEIPLEELPEGGFGWFLIRSLTRNLNYRRCGGCNRLGFTLLQDPVRRPER